MSSPASDPSLSDIDHRIAQAHQFWQQGQAAEARGDDTEAYARFTSAHDLVLDCPWLHEVAHRHLRRVNWRLGNYGELMTDAALAVFAPMGVFRLVAYFSRTPGRLHAACQRA